MLRFISSVRLAVILIAAIAGLSVSATIYDLPALFSSLPFRCCVVALFVNLLTCSVSLWPNLICQWRQNAKSFVGRGEHYPVSTLSEEALRSELNKQRFAIDEAKVADGCYLYAVRGKLPLLAPHLLHIAILVILVGALFSSFSVKDQIQLAPGDKMSLPDVIVSRTGPLELTVNDFSTRYDKYGAIDNWVTEFTLTDDKGTRTKAQTEVNRPYKAHGLSIYQMAYDKRYQVTIDGDEKEYNGVFDFPEDQVIPLPHGTMRWTSMADDVALVTLFDKNGKEVEQKGIRTGQMFTAAKGMQMRFDRTHAYTVLEVKYDRAMPLIYCGFALATLASCLFWLGRFSAVVLYLPVTGAPQVAILTKNDGLRRQLRATFGLEPSDEENL